MSDVQGTLQSANPLARKTFLEQQQKALTAYTPFPYYQLGEPLTPYLSLIFRGSPSFAYTFPNQENRIYVDRATFSVLDDKGYSTASISLADPDFVNLEALFLKALFLANSLTTEEGNWYCSAVWGWNSYGSADIYHTGNSGRHFYMLKDLTYDLTDIELRVSLELMDIGYATFATTDQAGTKGPTVGRLDQSAGFSAYNSSNQALINGGVESANAKILDPVAAGLNASLQGDKIPAAATATNTNITVTTTLPVAATTGSGGTAPSYTNVITGKTYWEIIQLVLLAHNIKTVARLRNQEVVPIAGPPGGADVAPSVDQAEGPASKGAIGQYSIPADASLKDTIEELKTHIPPVDASPGQPGKHWDILAGGVTDAVHNEAKQNMVWGWKTDPPKGDTNNQTTVGNDTTPKLSQNYRLARTFVYRPGYKGQIARGETQVLSLKYDWHSKGYLGVGLPAVYGITKNQNQQYHIYTTNEDFIGRNPNETDLLAGAKSSQPGIDSFNFNQIQKITGIPVHFNFDTSTMTDEKISINAKGIIINVWNYFLHEIINIQIDVVGDPWLDNTLFLSDGSVADNDFFVDPFNSYFQVTIYKPGEGSYAVTNPILSGQYLCLHGIKHNISEGEYTTSLELMKPF